MIQLLVSLTLTFLILYFIAKAIVTVYLFLVDICYSSGGKLFCRHKFKSVQRKDLQGGYFDECKKCGRLSKY